GTDAVYDAAIRRAGMLRVAGLDELFSAVETLGRIKPLRNERLGIIANGRAIAAMAVDTLIGKDGRLAAIGDATVESLRKTATAAHLIGNPIILNEKAPPEQYGIATETLLQAGGVDAVMVLHAPISGVSSTKAAEAVAQVARKTRGAADQLDGRTASCGGPAAVRGGTYSDLRHAEPSSRCVHAYGRLLAQSSVVDGGAGLDRVHAGDRQGEAAGREFSLVWPQHRLGHRCTRPARDLWRGLCRRA
ncbi:MAG: hypothetical protein ACXW25_12005, partial [Rhodospirillales bacterium]